MLKPFFTPGAGNRYDVSTHRRRHGRQQATGYTSAAVYENRFASLYIKSRTKNLMSCEGWHRKGTSNPHLHCYRLAGNVPFGGNETPGPSALVAQRCRMGHDRVAGVDSGACIA